MDAIAPLAQRIADRLGRIDGVVAVVLGGSWARGTAKPDSDIDLGLYYRPQHRPSLQALRALAAEIDERHPGEAVTDFGEWGPWINGGAWLVVEGHQVDWLFRDLDRVAHTIDECRAGRPTCDYQIGHPHGFHSHIYVGEVHSCQPLHDPRGTLAQLKALTAEYPPLLQQALISTFLFEAQFSLDISRKAAQRADTAYVSGCLFRCVASLVQVLFALNERYLINEKGAVALIESLPVHPVAFAATVSAALGTLGTDPASMCANVERVADLVRRVRALCETRTDRVSRSKWDLANWR